MNRFQRPVTGLGVQNRVVHPALAGNTTVAAIR